MSDLYDTDTVLWSDHQADLLRRRAAGELVNDTELDWPHIAEEIEALGKSARSALASRIASIIEHLAKLETSPATEPRRGWQETVLRARGELERILRDNPSLRPTLDDVIKDEHAAALRLAGNVLALYGETPRVPLMQLHYSRDQVLGPWLPEDHP